jgi:hypothetical protein
MEKAEMEYKETEDRGVESKLYGGGGAMRGDGTTRQGKQEGGMMRGKVTTSRHIERRWRWRGDATTSRGKQEGCASRGDVDNQPAALLKNCKLLELRYCNSNPFQFLVLQVCVCQNQSIAILCLPKYCNTPPPLRTVFCLQAVCPGSFYHSI